MHNQFVSALLMRGRGAVSDGGFRGVTEGVPAGLRMQSTVRHYELWGGNSLSRTQRRAGREMTHV